MSLLVQIAGEDNLRQAFRHIAANNGRPGVDNISIDDFAAQLETNLRPIATALLAGSYTPQPALAIELAEKKRTVSILTVADRVVTQACHQILVSVIEPYLHDASYAYRPRRSAIQASQQLQQLLASDQFPTVLRCDIYQFFDHVNHSIAAHFLEWTLPEPDPGTIALIYRLLQQPQLLHGQLQDSTIGLCQGSPLSPLLANLYLTPLDRYLERSGYRHLRFSDDLVILLPQADQAQPLRHQIDDFLRDYLDLQLHPDKVVLAHFREGFDFLGFHFSPSGRRPSQNSQERLRARLALIEEEQQRNQALIQWENYYGKGSADLTAPPALPAAKNRPAYPIITLMLRLFRGNPRCFARAYNNGRHCGYIPVARPMDEADIMAHLLGRETIGLYLLDQDQIYCSCLDLDIETRIMDTCYHNHPGEFAAYENRVLQQARRFEQSLRQLGLAPLLEQSGYKGYHLWLFFAGPVPARQVICLWKILLRHIGAAPRGIKREIFPREERAHGRKLGSLIKLPLGLHPQNQARSIFIDDVGEPIANPLQLLAKIPKATADIIHDIANGRKQPLVVTAAIERLLNGCNAVRYLVIKAKQQRYLGHFERSILLYTLGQLGEDGEKILHRTIGFCYNYDRRYTQRQIEKKHPAPMGCRRIQEIMGEELEKVECRCRFSLPDCGYASPLLHVDSNATHNLAQAIKR